MAGEHRRDRWLRYWDKTSVSHDRQMRFYDRVLLADSRPWVCAQATGHTLEVAIGTGLNLPLYPATCRLTGIDLSQEMLDKAVERVQTLAMPNVILKVMDATSMSFGDNEFDKVVATYTISAVPDPVAVLREMRRVVKPGGILVILNHFRSERRVTGWIEDMLAPVCTRLGWKSNLPLAPLLEQVGLVPESIAHVNMFDGWRLVTCINRK